MINVGIIGATGYAGLELVRILFNHPNVKISAVGSVSFEGRPISEIYPALYGIFDMACCPAEEVIDKSDVVFASVQHGFSQDFAAKCDERGKLFIDLGADFRLNNENDYEQWYSGQFSYPALHKSAVYGLPELYREKIKGKKIVANPGCYPTSAALALYPALKEGLVSTQGIVIDAKSGVTGAGRQPTDTGHFPNCNEAFSPYKIASHRHTPEIEQTLGEIAGEKITVLFVPHLLPVNRGIISTVYAKVSGGATLEKIRNAYENAYKNERFVRVLKDGAAANLRNVKLSNYCDISLHLDCRTNTLVIVSAIDNMVKGAAGQAVQNMNILLEFPEETGLMLVPTSF